MSERQRAMESLLVLTEIRDKTIKSQHVQTEAQNMHIWSMMK